MLELQGANMRVGFVVVSGLEDYQEAGTREHVKERFSAMGLGLVGLPMQRSWACWGEFPGAWICSLRNSCGRRRLPV